MRYTRDDSFSALVDYLHARRALLLNIIPQSDEGISIFWARINELEQALHTEQADMTDFDSYAARMRVMREPSNA